MKKLILVLALISIFPVASMAAENGGNGAQAISPGGSDGCGLGWQVTDKKTWLGTTTRGTTNGTIPPTFGMTSGTIGCEQHPIAKNDQQGAIYAYNNYDSLSVEMAQGHGEALAGLAQAMGCSNVDGFARMTQANYKAISSAPNALDMFDAVKAKVAADPSSCNVI